MGHRKGADLGVIGCLEPLPLRRSRREATFPPRSARRYPKSQNIIEYPLRVRRFDLSLRCLRVFPVPSQPGVTGNAMGGDISDIPRWNLLRCVFLDEESLNPVNV